MKGDQIPIEARIIAVADTFDAMTSTRPYREALPVEVAIEEIERSAGTQFDPDVVEVAVKVLEKLWLDYRKEHAIIQKPKV